MDLTSALDFNSELETRAAEGYFCDIYRGQLRDGTAVAIKTVKPYDYETNDHWRKAPELIYPGSKNTIASDVYALGMETVTRSLPYSEMIVENGVYEEEDILELLSSGLLPQRPEDSIPQTDAGEVIWDVLCKCWSSDPAYRPSAVDVSQIVSCEYLYSRTFQTKLSPVNLDAFSAPDFR
ncbi:kinase domain protein [Rhizoctonia solani 123E]|uniref:Kinase domain protein n=1 Tax=Rhizoctonia solani 123E TaxID=1423351 RepID=A0A074RQ84_9AGAM|nr:kinase domain protein [Rhizoctonia solani 123E]